MFFLRFVLTFVLVFAMLNAGQQIAAENLAGVIIWLAVGLVALVGRDFLIEEDAR